MVVTIVSRRDGQVTFAASRRTCWTNSIGFVFAMGISKPLPSRQMLSRQSIRPSPAGPRWQEWRDSNPQPPVLETGALPVELHS